jgi:Fe-S-cluster containining protein
MSKFTRVRLERPADAQRILKKVFSSVDCMACGICCESPRGTHNIAVTPDDPNYGPLRLLAESNLLAIVDNAMDGSFQIVGDISCAFLEKKKGRAFCSVYDYRPLLCAAYPFTNDPVSIATDDGAVIERDAIVLSTGCPVIRTLEIEGVGYVAFNEITETATEDGETVYRLTMPFMDVSLYGLLTCLESNTMFLRDNVLHHNGKAIFPVI